MSQVNQYIELVAGSHKELFQMTFNHSDLTAYI